MQFLYDSGDSAVFMDNTSYDQVEIPKSVVGDALKWVPPNSDVDFFVDERPAGAQPQSAVDLPSAKPIPGSRAIRHPAAERPATLETGVVVQVPLFIEEGERVRVDTRSGEYAPARGLGPMRRSDQRRDAVFALYQHEVTGRPIEELLEEAKPFTQEPRRRRPRRPRGTRRAGSRGTRRGGRWSDRAARGEHHAGRAVYEALHRDDVPVEVAIDEAVEPARSTAAPMRPVSSTGSSARRSRNGCAVD